MLLFICQSVLSEGGVYTSGEGDATGSDGPYLSL